MSGVMIRGAFTSTLSADGDCSLIFFLTSEKRDRNGNRCCVIKNTRRIDNMQKSTKYEDRLYAKIREQIRGKKVGFLLGAGASYLDGNGYPLAAGLWTSIKSHMAEEDQQLIDAKITSGYSTLEQALDATDRGQNEDIDIALRHRVSSAIATTFKDREPPLDCHRQFVVRLSSRNETRIPLFTLNYDPLVELAADQAQRPLIDGFCGTIECYFYPSCFNDFRGMVESRRGRSVPVLSRGIINLYKLHGSFGWFVDQQATLKRIRPDLPCPSGWRHLMIPPQNRKAADTGITPYAMLWSEFRAHLTNESARLINRLVCVGYGLGDGHVNAVINAALVRKHFTLIILAKVLANETFDLWRKHHNAVIVTETRSSLYGEEGPGVPDAWAFEWLAKEV